MQLKFSSSELNVTFSRGWMFECRRLEMLEILQLLAILPRVTELGRKVGKSTREREEPRTRVNWKWHFYLLGAVLVCGVKLQKSSTFLFLLSELVLVFWPWTGFRSILTVGWLLWGHWVYLWLVTCDAEQKWLLLSDSLWSSSTFEQLDVEGSSSEMGNIKTTLILRDVGLVFWYW